MTAGTASLFGQRVLLIAPRFFGYEEEIRAELIERGAVVDFVLDRPFSSAFMKALARFGRSWVLPAADRYVRSALAGRGPYDVVLVINGQTLSEIMVSELRRAHPAARFILYLWDSVENRASSVAIAPLFDSVLTFDPQDAARCNMRFRPLFFGPQYARPAAEVPDLDVSFIGTVHTDRYAVVSAVLRQLPPEATTWTYFYLQAKWVFRVQKVINPGFRRARIEEFSFDPLPKSKVHEIFRRSRCVLDVEHPQQRGLTIRTLETFGARKKLITTNSEVRGYDFYDPARVAVIDRANPRLPEDFLTSEFPPAPESLYYKYSIKGWMDDVLADGGGP